MTEQTSSCDSHSISVDMMMEAYSIGVFPMALNAASTDLVWMEPRVRGVIRTKDARIPDRLLQYMRSSNARLRVNTDFDRVVDACAETSAIRSSTWINSTLRRLYTQLHRVGLADSLEIWEPSFASGGREELVGGLFGLRVGAVFVGESMFSRQTRASQFALVCLFHILRWLDFPLLDCQFYNDHLNRFGCVQTSRDDYLRELQILCRLSRSSLFWPEGLSCQITDIASLAVKPTRD